MLPNQKDPTAKSVGPTGSNRSGFTLIELMVGISVAGLLFVALFQLLSNLTTIKETYFHRSMRTHRQTALKRVLLQDLHALPVTRVNFSGSRNEFRRTTVAHSPGRGLLLETRVHYFTRANEQSESLYREIKWVDLQDDFQEPRRLLESKSIEFSYLTESGQFVSKTSTAGKKIAGVKLETADFTVTVPAGVKSDEGDE